MTNLYRNIDRSMDLSDRLFVKTDMILMGRVVDLSREYPSRYGTPIIRQVDTEIFELQYFSGCMKYELCNDRCCSFGADIDIENVLRITNLAKDLEKYIGFDRSRWFKSEYIEEKEFPGGKYTRTAVVDGTCIFLNHKGRGCMIHKFCLEHGINYHLLKPLVCILFPVTFSGDTLRASNEQRDGTLFCYGKGFKVYRGVREEIEYFFGKDLVTKLDSIEDETNED